MLIEPDWLNMLVEGVKTTLRHSVWTSMILQPHTWTPRHCCILWTGMRISIAVYESRYTLRRAWLLPVYLVDEKGYAFEAYEWPWTKTGIHFPTFRQSLIVLAFLHYSSFQRVHASSIWMILWSSQRPSVAVCPAHRCPPTICDHLPDVMNMKGALRPVAYHSSTVQCRHKTG